MNKKTTINNNEINKIEIKTINRLKVILLFELFLKTKYISPKKKKSDINNFI
jgi:hypothetical protein